MKKQLYYIGRRYNPQFEKPYYKMYGQLSKTEAKKKEQCVYGSMSLTPYETEEAYFEAVKNISNEGFRIS